MTLRAGSEHDGPFDEGTNMRLQCLCFLGQDRPSNSQNEPLIGHIDAADLDLRGLLVEQIVSLLGREGGYRNICRKKTGFSKAAHLPATGCVSWDGDGAVIQGERLIEHLRQIDV